MVMPHEWLGITYEEWLVKVQVDKLTSTKKPKWVIKLVDELQATIQELKVEKCKLQLENRKLRDALLIYHNGPKQSDHDMDE